MRLLVIAALVSGCAHEIDELDPFPCPEDHVCPAGLVCADDQCVAPAPDRACFADFEDGCKELDSGYKCQELDPLSQRGFCTQPCTVDAGCSDGRLCGPGGICLRDCSQVNDCSPGTECLGTGGRPLCVPLAAPRSDDLCTTDATCGMRGLPAKCVVGQAILGRCLVTCTDDAGCGVDVENPSRVCAAPSTLGAMFCFESCDAAPCSNPDRDECQPASGTTGRMICVPKQVRVPLGQTCATPSQCDSGICGNVNGERRCTNSCVNDLQCDPGFTCLAGETAGGYCWPYSDRREVGCSTGGGAVGPVWLGALVLWSLRRRRRRDVAC